MSLGTVTNVGYIYYPDVYQWKLNLGSAKSAKTSVVMRVHFILIGNLQRNAVQEN